jgi:hypothetical protein
MPVDIEKARLLIREKTSGEWRSRLANETSTALVLVEQAGLIAHCFSPKGRAHRIADAAFIAYFGTHASEILDELEALRAIAAGELREMPDSTMAEVRATFVKMCEAFYREKIAAEAETHRLREALESIAIGAWTPGSTPMQAARAALALPSGARND